MKNFCSSANYYYRWEKNFYENEQRTANFPSVFFLRNEVFNCIHFWEIFLLQLNSMALCYNSEEELENRKFFCEKKEFSIFFSDVDGKKSPICRTFFGRGVKTISACPEEHFEKNVYIWKIHKYSYHLITFWAWAEILWPSDNLFWQGCQRCILRVHRDCLRKMNFSEKKRFFETFRYWMKNFWPLVERLLAGLSKLDSTFSRKHFEEN